MCGIVGFAGDIGPDEIDAFGTSLFLDTVRGMDSTGIFYNKRGTNYNLKWVGCPWEVPSHYSDHFCKVNSSKTRLVLDDVDTIMLGHNRWATMGSIDEDSAHPFEHGSIVGVHNGTVKGGLKYVNDYSTDSEAIIKHLSECKNDNDIQEVWDTINIYGGAAALVWYDKDTKILRLLRNEKRPLYIGTASYTENKKLLYNDNRIISWNSNRGMLNYSVYNSMTRGFSMGNKKNKWGESPYIFSLKPNTIYAYIVQTGGLERLEDTELKQVAARPYYERAYGFDLTHEHWFNEETKEEKEEKNKKKSFAGYLGTLFNKKSYNKLLKKGCAMCGVVASDPDDIQWVGIDSYICQIHTV